MTGEGEERPGLLTGSWLQEKMVCTLPDGKGCVWIKGGGGSHSFKFACVSFRLGDVTEYFFLSVC